MLCGLAAAFATIAAPPPPAVPPAAPTRIRVVTDNNYPPFLFLDGTGEPQGYEVDMWRLFQAHTGIQVDLVPMAWNDAQQELLAGKADVIDMIYRTPARTSLYEFSAPYAKQEAGIYVARELPGIRDTAALHGFSVAVERGDACAEHLRAQGVTDLHEYTNYREVIHAAVDGSIRIFCMDSNPANYYLYRYSALDKFYPAYTLYTGHTRRAVRRGNGAMLRTVEDGMAKITPAERRALRQRWLERPAMQQPYVHVARIALAVVLALVVLMTLWVWSLRRTVAVRTRELRSEKSNLRALFDASPDATWVSDGKGILLDCNDRMSSLFGRARETLLGRTVFEAFDARNMRFATTSRSMSQDVLAQGKPRNAIVAYQTPDAEDRQLELTKVPLHSPDGTVHGVLTVARDVTARLHAEAQLRLWAHAFQNAAFGVAICDSRTKRMIAVNPVFARERGYTPEELVGTLVDALYPADMLPRQRELRAEADRREHSVWETEQVARDGRRFPVLLDCSVIHDDAGAALYAIVYAQDITERKRADTELRLAAVAFQTQEALLVTDAEGNIQRVNQAFTRLTGYRLEEVQGQPSSFVGIRREDGAFQPQRRDPTHHDGFWQEEQWIQVKHGQPRVVRAAISAVADARGEVTHYVCTMVDLTSEREAHASVDHMTFFDPLTDLPNRHFLRNHLKHLLDEDEGFRALLLLIDLDHFKRVNDLRGHAAGDHLLTLIAQRLRRLVEGDSVLARLGGGTFALVVPCEQSSRTERMVRARECAERARQALREPFRLASTDTAVTITASIGWSELAAGHDTPESVLREAELAMYGAKAAGRDQVCRFEPEMLAELAQREGLVHDLRDAIAQGAMALELQAQVDRWGRVLGAEALLRWTRRGTPVPPTVFIPIAEESGLIVPLGEWVLQRACKLLVAWSERPATRALTLAVNVSARQFNQTRFVDGVRNALATSGADPSRLKLEITETTILGDLDEAAVKLTALRGQGIRISLDDFGTGYSSLTYLSRLPLDQLKIDQSFVACLPEDANGAMVAQTIIGMGRGLGLEVIAEGVETTAQRQFLMTQGCDVFQGYLIGRPMPPAEFEAMLEKNPAPV
jgi:diguanylate cyclase (GGDEF)-like protein/PAS domain S-box-containing protein